VVHFDEKQGYCSFLFNEPTYSDFSGNDGEHFPVGTIFQLYGSLPHFSHHVHAFLDREVLDNCIEGRGTLLSRYDSSGLFLLGVCEGHCLL